MPIESLLLLFVCSLLILVVDIEIPPLQQVDQTAIMRVCSLYDTIYQTCIVVYSLSVKTNILRYRQLISSNGALI